MERLSDRQLNHIADRIAQRLLEAEQNRTVKYLTTAEKVERMGISVHRLRHMARAGLISCRKQGDGPYSHFMF